MPFYTCTFPRDVAGRSVTVRDAAGSTVASGTLGQPDSRGMVAYTFEVEAGGDASEYTGTATTIGGATIQARGLFNVTSSLASVSEGSPVGATETAYFIATGPVYTTDGGGAAGALNFVADPDHGDLPSWASLSSGDIVLGAEAGTCAFNLNGVMDFDFSSTDAPTASGAVGPGLIFNVNGSSYITGLGSQGSTAGTGADEQTTDAVNVGGVLVGESVSVEAYPSADDGGNIPDGTATPRVALTITRIAQAAVLPEA